MSGDFLIWQLHSRAGGEVGKIQRGELKKQDACSGVHTGLEMATFVVGTGLEMATFVVGCNV
jgi:3-oxoacyl-[acyl-carrier-protein] synthase III